MTCTVAADAVLNILRGAGLSRDALDLPKGSGGERWPGACAEAAWNKALGRGLGPFELAGRTQLKQWGLLGFIAQTAPSVRSGVEAVAQRMALLTECGQWSWSKPDTVQRISGPPTCDEALAVDLSSFAHFVACTREIGGRDSIQSVALRYDVFGARNFFEARGISVLVGAPHDAFALGPSSGKESDSQVALHKYLCDDADRQLTALTPTDLPSRVRQILCRDPAETQASVIAKQLAMSPRNLRRRLADASVSLTTIADEMRCAEARAQFRAGASIADVSEYLGFSDPSAFARAYRRWTGQAPSQLRAVEQPNSAFVFVPDAP